MDQSLTSPTGTSDLTILCGPFSYHVHRHIVCPQSSFFERACQAEFPVGNTRQITLYDDPETVERMIAHLYGHDYEDYNEKDPYPDPSTTPKPSFDPLSTPTPANPMAKKTFLRFPIPQVFKQRPQPKFRVSLSSDPNRLINTILLYRLAHRYAIPTLLALALDKFTTITRLTDDRKELGDVMKYVYECSDGEKGGWEAELKKVVVKFMAGRMQHEMVEEAMHKTGFF